MIYKGSEAEKSAIFHTAERMCVAARTAPKGRGIDNIITAIVTSPEKETLADEMEKIGKREGIDFFVRDAQNVRQSEAVVLIGTRLKTRGIPYCGFCGFENCSENIKNKGVCAYDITDLGIAVGSAVSLAADERVDNRVMFSIGRTAMDLKLMGDETGIIYGIPLSAKGKSIYYDRSQVTIKK